jgi:N-acetyltransferase
MAFVFPFGFDPQPTLQGFGLTVRPLRETDRDGLAEAASDPAIWVGHPASNRYQREVFDRYFDTLLSIGGALIILDDDQRVIGCTAYYTDTNHPSRLSLGFTFLVRDLWGGATNRIVKRLSLGHLFGSASEAWFHIAPSNGRSQAATQRLGAVYLHDAVVDLGGGPLVWRYYCLSQEKWAAFDLKNP